MPMLRNPAVNIPLTPDTDLSRPSAIPEGERFSTIVDHIVI